MIALGRQRNVLQTGKDAEQKARRYLEQQGLKWRASNYRCRMGEIDLVMEAPEGTLVFVEVRLRTQAAFGSACESVTYSKQKKLLKAASHYLMRHPRAGSCGVRFDVLALDGKCARITWIKQAFEDIT